MSELALRQKEVLANVGRNIVMFQGLEGTMKHLVPLFSTVGVVSPEGVGKRHAKAKKQTLGLLVGDFLKKSNSDNPEFAAHYASLVEQRNVLVHHFGEAYGNEFKTVEGCERIIDRLKAQFEQVKELRHSLRGLLAAMFACLCEATFAGTEEYAEMRAMCEQLLAQLDPRYLPEISIEPAPANSVAT